MAPSSDIKQKISGFVSNEEEYHSTFDLFTRNRIEQQQVWVDHQLIPRIKRNFKDCAALQTETFKVLAVGPSIGKFDILLMEEMKRLRDSDFNPKKISWTVVEPNKAALEKFKEKVEQNEVLKGYFEFTWINETFEEYMGERDANNNEEKFHFVHFVHCLYYMQEEIIIRETLEKLVAQNGMILAVVGTEGDIWTMLLQAFNHKLNIPENYPTNASLSKLADNDQNGWEYESFKGKLDLEITEIFNPDDQNGIAILQFFLHTKENPYLVHGQELMQEVIEFFRKKAWLKRDFEKEQFFVCDDEGIVVIKK